jgi:putative Mg2+ transporter-C (MgtC) family protein
MHWVAQNLLGVLPAPWAQILLTLSAIVCGGIIGTERERHQKSAGLRTLMLVCLGSTVFTMASFAFTSTTGDSGRVAAQIVTGIGFLGAGAILHSRSGVTGMTTAATIWVAASIGMTVGAGYPISGIALAVVVRTVLAGIYGWEIRHLGGLKTATVELLFDPDHGKTRIRLDRARQETRIDAEFSPEEPLGEDLVRSRIHLYVTRSQLCEFLGSVADLPEIREIRGVRTEEPPAQVRRPGSRT